MFVLLGLRGSRPVQPESYLLCATFMFRVTDAETGQPIEGALILLSGADEQEFPWRDRHPMRTREDGRAGIASECFTDGELLVYPNWTFVVSAPGYQSTAPVRLAAHTGTRGKLAGLRINIALVRDPNARPEK